MVQGVTRGPEIAGRYVPSTGEMSVRTGVTPKQYGQTLAHELGHVGSYARAGGYPLGFAQEEVRQRVADTMNTPTFSAQNLDAQGYLANPQLRSGMGMAFTPSLPASMPVKDQSRVAPTFNTQMVRPQVPGSYPAAPRMSPFGNVGQEYHQHSAPPTPSQYRNEMPPAAPNVGTPASQTATLDDGGTGFLDGLKKKATEKGGELLTAATEKLEEHREANKKFGPKTVLAAIEQKAGKVPQILKGYGESNGPNIRIQQPVQLRPVATAMAAPQPSIPQLEMLLQNMRANGATQEEIAFVESLIASQNA
jgi:hypothetical protein